jgi:hypothetical protein
MSIPSYEADFADPLPTIQLLVRTEGNATIPHLILFLITPKLNPIYAGVNDSHAGGGGGADILRNLVHIRGLECGAHVVKNSLAEVI